MEYIIEDMEGRRLEASDRTMAYLAAALMSDSTGTRWLVSRRIDALVRTVAVFDKGLLEQEIDEVRVRQY